VLVRGAQFPLFLRRGALSFVVLELLMLLLLLGFTDEFAHAGLRLGHLQDLFLLLGDVRVEITGNLRVQDRALVRHAQHVTQLRLHGSKLGHLYQLLLLQFFVLKELFALL